MAIEYVDPSVKCQLGDKISRVGDATGAATSVSIKPYQPPESTASALLHLGRAMSEGRLKYGLYNWRKTKVQSDIYFDAIMRHVWAWNDGEELADGPMKCHHLAHVMAGAAILLDAMETGMLVDNRGTPGNLPEIINKWQTKKE
jgi:hypothetical protein